MQFENLPGGYQLIRLTADDCCKQASISLEPLRVKLDTLSRMKSLDEHIFRIQLAECVHSLQAIEKLLSARCIIQQTNKQADEPRAPAPGRGSGFGAFSSHSSA